MFRVTPVAPQRKRTSPPRPKDADQTATAQPRPTTHLFVAARPNPNGNRTGQPQYDPTQPATLHRRPTEPQPKRRR